VQFSLTLPGLTSYAVGRDPWPGRLNGAEIAELARTADELGFDQVRISEHIGMHRDFVDGLGPRWSHSLTSAGLVAGATRRIRIVPLIVIPYHHPVELAQAIATLDFLSDGRVTLLAAVGYMEWEFELLGVPYAERGRITDASLDTMIGIWTTEEPTAAGIVFEPKPVQKPHPPIWIAGYAKAALRRLARVGSGWITYNTSRAELPEMLRYLAEQQELRGRTGPVEIGMPLFEYDHHPVTHELLAPPNVVLERDAILEQVAELGELGTTIVRVDAALGTGPGSQHATRSGRPVPPVRSREEYVERLHWFAEEILGDSGV
jgi:alkanesulfonate monooxygenase SsuD/methylene tetrahydromethanopterin reductase-like flavin-dependent oxidoreductase (luciferase family)